MPDPTPAADRPTEVLAATIESVLRESLPVWWQTPPRLDWAALAVARQLLAVPHAPAVWSDGDPLMEAVASAVWEQCRTENSIVVDDPRNIAAVAATVARQLLGTTTSEGPAAAPTTAAMLSTPCDACDHTLNWHRNDVGCTVPRCVCGRFQDPVEAAAPPAPADRAALTDAERQFLTFAMDLAFDEMASNDGFTDEDHAALEKFRALATPPAAPAAPEERP
ncbi:hypothetical protein [Streptomyces anulatus]|uniref:hypothetical protein n=1 Tax=Streptomyces anulatus TaxID=1892 RepID=UPI002E0FD89C|nr:hypothetical protein OG557_39060 [Streptomyces anulatus]